MLLYSSFEKEGEALIKVDGINKSFKVAKRATGLVEGLKALVSREHTIVHALNDVSFTINPGEIVGYIGPNGAGKSTTIKVMSGILVPDSGSCEIMGYTPWKDRVEYVKNIGVVFGQRSQLWWDVPVIDSFALLKDILHSPVRQLSLGQRMRCEIAASLIHNPQILFLDEPTIGLDAVSKIAVRNFIKKINKQKNVTVILTTHDMFDIEALCDRVILIGKGSLLYDGNLQELRNRFGSHRTITVDYKSSNIPIQIPGTINLSRTEERAILSVDTTQISVSEVIMELSHSLDLVDISVMSQPIEDIIVQLYKEYEI